MNLGLCNCIRYLELICASEAVAFNQIPCKEGHLVLCSDMTQLLGQLGGEYTPVTQFADTAQDGNCQCILFLRKDFILIQTDVCNEHAALFIV